MTGRDQRAARRHDGKQRESQAFEASGGGQKEGSGCFRRRAPADYSIGPARTNFGWRL